MHTFNKSKLHQGKSRTKYFIKNSELIADEKDQTTTAKSPHVIHSVFISFFISFAHHFNTFLGILFFFFCKKCCDTYNVVQHCLSTFFYFNARCFYHKTYAIVNFDVKFVILKMTVYLIHSMLAW